MGLRHVVVQLPLGEADSEPRYYDYISAVEAGGAGGGRNGLCVLAAGAIGLGFSEGRLAARAAPLGEVQHRRQLFLGRFYGDRPGAQLCCCGFTTQVVKPSEIETENRKIIRKSLPAAESPIPTALAEQKR